MSSPIDQRKDNLTFGGLVSQERAVVASVEKSAVMDAEAVANKMAVEVAFLLSEQMQELDVFSSDFRRKLLDMCRWGLSCLSTRKERCVVIPDCIPGFTMMGFRKEGVSITSAKGAPPSRDAGSDAVALVIDKFLGRSSNMCLIIDCRDIILALFPVSDLKTNLKILGFDSSVSD